MVGAGALGLYIQSAWFPTFNHIWETVPNHLFASSLSIFVSLSFCIFCFVNLPFPSPPPCVLAYLPHPPLQANLVSRSVFEFLSSVGFVFYPIFSAFHCCHCSPLPFAVIAFSPLNHFCLSAYLIFTYSFPLYCLVSVIWFMRKKCV